MVFRSVWCELFAVSRAFPKSLDRVIRFPVNEASQEGFSGKSFARGKILALISTEQNGCSRGVRKFSLYEAVSLQLYR